MARIDVLEEQIRNLSARVDSHDERHSKKIGEIEMSVQELKVFKAQLVGLAAAGSVIGSLLFALAQALLKHG